MKQVESDVVITVCNSLLKELAGGILTLHVASVIKVTVNLALVRTVST